MNDGARGDHGLDTGGTEFNGFLQHPFKGLGFDHGRQQMNLMPARLVLLQ